jgi:hypothetical protein
VCIRFFRDVDDGAALGRKLVLCLTEKPFPCDARSAVAVRDAVIFEENFIVEMLL